MGRCGWKAEFRLLSANADCVHHVRHAVDNIRYCTRSFTALRHKASGTTLKPYLEPFPGRLLCDKFGGEERNNRLVEFGVKQGPVKSRGALAEFRHQYRISARCQKVEMPGVGD